MYKPIKFLKDLKRAYTEYDPHLEIIQTLSTELQEKHVELEKVAALHELELKKMTEAHKKLVKDLKESHEAFKVAKELHALECQKAHEYKDELKKLEELSELDSQKVKQACEEALQHKEALKKLEDTHVAERQRQIQLERKNSAEREAHLEAKYKEAESLAHQYKQESEAFAGDLYHARKAAENQKAQSNISVELLQKEVMLEKKERAELKSKNERMQNLLADMSLYMIDPKDIDGKIFSRIAPLIDAEGYELLKSGEGRLKAKIIEPGRKSRVIYLEKAD